METTSNAVEQVRAVVEMLRDLKSVRAGASRRLSKAPDGDAFNVAFRDLNRIDDEIDRLRNHLLSLMDE